MGTPQAGPGRRTCPAVRGGSGGVGGVRDERRLAPGSPAVAAKGRGHQSAPATQTRTRTGKAGSVLPGAPPCVEGTGVTLVLSPSALLCPLPRGPDAKYLAPERIFLSESGCDLSLPRGGKGGFPPPGENRCVVAVLKKMLCTLPPPAPVFQQCQPARVLNLKHNYK